MSRFSQLALSTITVLTLGLTLSACGGGGGGGGGGANVNPAPTPPPPNSAPLADAGVAQTAAGGANVILDGSASSDSDGSITTYAWSQTEGPEVTLTNADTATASFVAPQLLEENTLTFRLSVTDNDGASTFANTSVTVLASTQPRASLSGRITPAVSQSLDSDTNDPFNPFQPNDSPDAPQPLTNPTTLGGYVNEAGSGTAGRSQTTGDLEDYFLVELLEGQVINLVVAEFQDADADLYLYDQNGNLLDFSIETGERESVQVAESGTYLVNVSAFSGATNYTLAIGSSLIPEHHHYDDVIPGELILSSSDDRALRTMQSRLTRDLRLRQMGGASGRERLLALDVNSGFAELRLGRHAYRRSQFGDRDQAQRWDTLMTIKALNRDPSTPPVEPNYRVYPLASVNDEAYGFQWHYPLINVPGAWDTTIGNSEVVVAVVDTGVLGAHPDLAGQLVDGYDFIRDPDEGNDGDGIDPNPEEDIGNANPSGISFHGTHVTGTIGAAGNNGIGVTGVAYGSRVMPLRAITDTGGTSYDVGQAIRYAAGLPNDSGTVPERPARIINLSLGGGSFSPSTQNLFNQLRSLGIVVVASAGNESSTAPSYPASYDHVISVSAVDAQQQITGYSNTGATIDIAAPGGDGSADLNGDGYPDGVLSTGASDGEFAYTFLSGTSMASPHVAGVIALMVSANPNLDADDIDRLLENGALTDDLGAAGRDNRYGHGLINARKAVEAALVEAGGSSSVEPRLAASSSALNFAAVATEREVLLRNAGGGSLSDVSLRSDDPWISIDSSASDEAGLGSYRIRVDRSALAPGVYEGQLTASSSANDLTVRVLLSVADTLTSDLGQIYLLLFDPVSDQLVAQTAPTLEDGVYRWELPDVLAGSYQLFAGTDLDNDLLICDPGEACGAYPTLDQPLTLELTGDSNDLDFAIEYLIVLPSSAETRGADGAATNNISTLEREESAP